jgi:hypothetical protein
VYETYSRQALPTKEYRALLGSAICVFNCNNAFIIENILRSDEDEKYSWYKLIDLESGKLHSFIKETIADAEISDLFTEIVYMRNRIIHGFQITDKKDNEQRLATKTKAPENKQFIITEEYLMEFIKLNEKLCDLLHDYRGF